MAEISIVEAVESRALEQARALILEYADSRGFPLTWQGFDQEIASLPGDYAPPLGGLFVALLEDEPVGCVAFRPLPAGPCEMKRLYVRPEARGQGAGRLLCECAISEARRVGYAEMLLDTLERMSEANELYASLGFVETSAYRFNPLPDVHYLRLEL